MAPSPPPVPACCPTLVPLSGNILSVPPAMVPALPGCWCPPLTPSCPHPSTATAPSPLCHVPSRHALPQVPKPGPGRGTVSPHVPVPRPLRPVWLPGEQPVALAPRGGGRGESFQGENGQGDAALVPGCGIAGAGPADNGRQWRVMLEDETRRDATGMVGMLLPGAALPTSCLSNRNREKRRASRSASRRRSVGPSSLCLSPALALPVFRPPLAAVASAAARPGRPGRRLPQLARRG